MQTWAKRGIKTALVTGGLLMLGTGIASADESVNPDSPAGPLDANLNIPVQIEKNALGTPVGQANLPGYKGEISTKPVTKPLKGVTDPLQKAAAPASKATAPPAGVTETATSAVSSAAGKTGASRTTQDVSGLDIDQNDDVLKGNKVDLDVTAPIQICGNAIGVIGDAVIEDADCGTQSYSNNEDTTTDGKYSGLAGNAVVLDWALPVQIAGNAGGVAGGSGYTSGSAEQEVTETGNISTDGTGSGASGNVVAGQFATPVQVTGNAASWILGNAYSEFDAETEADSGGWIQTNGDGGAATGNVVGVPIALPVKFNGNAAGAWGSDADSVSHSEADATAGGTTPGLNDIPAYITTEGDKAFLAGTVVQPQGALVANVAGNAASWIGNATTGNAQEDEYAGAGSSSSEVEAGGFSSTTGQDGAGTGNIVDLPVAVPVEAFGIGGTYIGNAHAAHDNETSATAGEGTYTTGDGSFLSANTVTGQPALTGEVFGIGGSHIGNASGTATETKTVQSGGYNGSTGNDSSGSGNIVQVPLAVPAEIFGVGGSYIGQGEGTASETKEIIAGGGGNTDEDNGLGSSNLVATPLAVPAQVFGIGGSHIGRGTGEATADNVTSGKVGGDTTTAGTMDSVSGFDGQVPVGVVAQIFDVPLALLGVANAEATNATDIMVDNREPQIDFGIDGSELPLDAVPSLNWPSLPGVPGVPTGLGRDGGMGLPTNGLPTPGLPPVPSLPGLPGLPGAAAQRADAPVPSLPGAPDLGTVTDLPSAGTLPLELSGMNLTSGDVLGGGLPTDTLLSGDPTGGVLPTDAVLGGGLPVDPTTVPMDNVTELPVAPQDLLPTADVPAMAQVDSPLNIFQKFLSVFSGK